MFLNTLGYFLSLFFSQPSSKDNPINLQAFLEGTCVQEIVTLVH
jgi:hypothetical protein